MQERRKFERKSSSIRVVMSHPTFGVIIGAATDISDGGARVRIENETIPPVGTEVSVQFKKMIGHINDEPVAMKVMHTTKNALGLMLLPR